MDALSVWTGSRNKLWSHHLTKFKLQLNKLREEGGFGLNTARRLVYRDCGSEWIALGGSFWERHQDGSLRPMPDVCLVSFCQNSLKNHQQGRVSKKSKIESTVTVSPKVQHETEVQVEVEEPIGSFELDFSMEDEQQNDLNMQEAATGDVRSEQYNNNDHSRDDNERTTGITEVAVEKLPRRSQRRNKGVHSKLKTYSSPSEEILEEETEEIVLETNDNEPPVRVSKRERKKRTFLAMTRITYLHQKRKRKSRNMLATTWFIFIP